MTTYSLRTVSAISLLTMTLAGSALGGQEQTSGSPAPSIQPYVQPAEPAIEPLTDRMPATDVAAGTEMASTEAVSLLGRPVRNLQGERLGEVDTVLVTTHGQVSAIVVGTGGLLGLGQDHYEIPWSQVQWQENGPYLTVDVAEDHMKAEFSAFEFN